MADTATTDQPTVSFDDSSDYESAAQTTTKTVSDGKNGTASSVTSPAVSSNEDTEDESSPIRLSRHNSAQTESITPSAATDTRLKTESTDPAVLPTIQVAKSRPSPEQAHITAPATSSEPQIPDTSKAPKVKLAKRPPRTKSSRSFPGAPEDGWDDGTPTEGTVISYRAGSGGAGQAEIVRRVAFPYKLVQMKAIHGSGAWSFCKVFGDGEFIAGGYLNVPPFCSKEAKGTKDNTYIFHVLDGAVRVKIHQSEYVLSPGGMFMAPRGNIYSITNISERTARLVFTQAREIHAPPSEIEDPLYFNPSHSLPSTSSTIANGILSRLPASQATMLLGFIIERSLKHLANFKKLFLAWYLRTSFSVARQMTGVRPYILCFILGFLFKRIINPFGHWGLNVQVLRPTTTVVKIVRPKAVK